MVHLQNRFERNGKLISWFSEFWVSDISRKRERAFVDASGQYAAYFNRFRCHYFLLPGSDRDRSFLAFREDVLWDDLTLDRHSTAALIARSNTCFTLKLASDEHSK